MGINLSAAQHDLLRDDLNLGNNRTSIDRFSEAVRRQMDEEAGGASVVENGASANSGAAASFAGHWSEGQITQNEVSASKT